MSGPNPVHIDGDLLYSVAYGPSTLEAVNEFFAGAEPVFAKYGYVFLLTDATRSLAVTVEARRAIAEWGKTHRVAASAVFGPNATTRAMLTLVTSAMRLIGKKDQNIRFFATESEARAWLDVQRQEFYARRTDRAKQ